MVYLEAHAYCVYIVIMAVSACLKCKVLLIKLSQASLKKELQVEVTGRTCVQIQERS